MARRKVISNIPGPADRGKGARKRRNVFVGDRNRASPAPIIKMYDSLTDEQRAAIVSMGHGSFLDIKCEQLHNPVIHWFVQCYQPARRAFVIPCRGAIPLTEESVQITTGLPRGHIEVKYYVDNNLEAENCSTALPWGCIRPKVSDIGKMIEQYKGADDTFKELWMLFIMSTVVAPTTDTRMSNKCYPMLIDIGQAKELKLCKFIVDELHDHLSREKYTKGCLLYCMLRYFDALDTDHLVLELGDARFAINAWTREAVDGVSALDAQEHDLTKFGSMKLKDVYKDVLAREMGLFDGEEGFDSWMNLNTHPTCTEQRRIKAYTLMQTLASGLNTLLSNFVQGMTESTDEEINIEPHENDGEGLDEGQTAGLESEDDKEIPVAPLVAQPDMPRRIGKEVDTTAGQTPTIEEGQSSGSYSIPAMHSQIALPSDSDKDVSDESVGISGHILDSPIQCTQQVDEQIKGSGACLASRLNILKQQPIKSAVELGIHARTHADGAEHRELNKATKENEPNVLDNRSIPENGCDVLAANNSACPYEEANQDKGGEIHVDNHSEGVTHSAEGKSTSKRKRRSFLSTTPARKSPRLAKIYSEQGGTKAMNDEKSACTAFELSPTANNKPAGSNAASISGRRKRCPASDGKTHKTAIPISPTVGISPVASNASSFSGSSKISTASDGKSKATAIPISPAVTNSSPAINATSVSAAYKISANSDGKSKSNAIQIPPAAIEVLAKSNTYTENTCRSIVVSPKVQGNSPRGSGKSTRARRFSSFLAAQLGIPGFPGGSPVVFPPEVEKLVTSLSHSVMKQGVLPRIDERERSSAGGSSQKRKHVDVGGPSTSMKRDNRMGMFTPPPFDLGLSSQEGSGSESPLACVGTQEDAAPKFLLNVDPIAWAEPEGNTSKSAEGTAGDSELVEFKLSKEVEDYILNKTDYLSTKGAEELTRYEEFCMAFSKRKRELVVAAAPEISLDGSAIQSITPKVQPHKARVKNPSRFNQSPFVVPIKVIADQDAVYQKIMLSHKSVRPSKSNLKKYQIIKYTDSWVYTGDLADSIHARGEISNHCMEAGIEYLRRTNKVEGKMIMPYQIADYLLSNQFEKKVVASYFKRRSDYSLSVLNQISFPVLEEITRGNKEGNHWYCLSMNFKAGRFEALDSFRGEGDEALTRHANALISRIKALWQIHYSTSKVNIQDWELAIVNVPIQDNLFDCGFHVLYNIEKWDGQNIPYIGKGDVGKLRRVMPYKWITADFNEEKEKWRWNLFNNAIRK